MQAADAETVSEVLTYLDEPAAVITEKVKEVSHVRDQLNKHEPSWVRKPENVPDAEYASFYNSLSNNWEKESTSGFCDKNDRTDIKCGLDDIRVTARSTLQEEKLKYTFEAGGKKKFHHALQESQDCFDKTQFAGKNEFEGKQKELEGVVKHCTGGAATQLYESSAALAQDTEVPASVLAQSHGDHYKNAAAKAELEGMKAGIHSKSNFHVSFKPLEDQELADSEVMGGEKASESLWSALAQLTQTLEDQKSANKKVMGDDKASKPLAVEEPHTKVDESRLQELRKQRKVCGRMVQLCMLCPRPVYPDEGRDECCEFCHAEVRPVLDPELVNRKRCELHALLAADV